MSTASFRDEFAGRDVKGPLGPVCEQLHPSPYLRVKTLACYLYRHGY